MNPPDLNCIYCQGTGEEITVFRCGSTESWTCRCVLTEESQQKELEINNHFAGNLKNKLTDAELLDAAITLLTEWCMAVEEHGASWDDWDEYYKEANFRPGPLRELIDKKKEELDP